MLSEKGVEALTCPSLHPFSKAAVIKAGVDG